MLVETDQNQPTQVTCTLIGSLNKFLDHINNTHYILSKAGVEILAPKLGQSMLEIDGFKVLDSDQNCFPIDIEMGFIWSLLQSDFAYIVNPNGYIGANSTTEIAIALSYGMPVFSMEPLDESLDAKNSEWKILCDQIKYVPLETLTKEVATSSSLLHTDINKRTYCQPNEQGLQDLALYVLASDWLKHRGLGELIKEVKRHYPHFLLKVPQSTPVLFDKPSLIYSIQPWV